MPTVFTPKVKGISNVLSRRSAFSLMLGSAGAQPLSDPLLWLGKPKIHDLQPFSLDIRSPKDCYVISLSVKNGATVAAGNTICQLDSDDEDRALEKLRATKALLDLEQMKLSPEVVLKQRRLLEIASSVAEAYLQLAYTKNREDRQWAMDVSMLPTTVVGDEQPLMGTIHQSSAAITKALAEVEKANLAVERFDFSAAQSASKFALISAQLPAEQQRIMTDKARLAIVSPINGTVSLNIANGSFLSKGTVMASVHS